MLKPEVAADLHFKVSQELETMLAIENPTRHQKNRIAFLEQRAGMYYKIYATAMNDPLCLNNPEYDKLGRCTYDAVHKMEFVYAHDGIPGVKVAFTDDPRIPKEAYHLQEVVVTLDDEGVTLEYTEEVA